MSCSDPRRADLERFARGELDADAATRVLEHVEACAECSRELDFLADVAATLATEGTASVHAAGPHAPSAHAPTVAGAPHALGAPSSSGDARTRPTLRRAITVLALAAAAIVIVELTPFPGEGLEDGPAPGVAGDGGSRDEYTGVSRDERTGPSRNARVFGRGGAPTFVHGELRGVDEDLASRFVRAMEPYERGDWKAAIESLTEFLAHEPDHAPARFYRAEAELEAGDAASARADLEHVAEHASDFLRDHATWELARLDYEDGDSSAATKRLEDLRARGGDFAANAERALVELARE